MRDGRPLGEQARVAEKSMLESACLRQAGTRTQADPRRLLHPPLDRLAVSEASVPGRALEGVGNCVAVILDGPNAAFVRAAANDRGFDGDRSNDRLANNRRSAAPQARQILPQPIKELAVADDGCLDDFGK